ncbi:hypothetical protein MLD38_018683 [Melastoma candidum]|uniref:Uncharacterized protein n=1 Tax=Melastoma candidum TaxID=119954 RepID=A0ACB9QUJ3_9MYRT|nr:hypothetical protein MLD38_018683 [Melastoma candidum]
MARLHYFFVAAVSLALHMGCDVVSGSDTDFLSRICNGNIFPGYWHEKDYPETLVQKIVDNTPDADGHEYYTHDKYYSVDFCGHGVCTAGMSREDCSTCLKAARDNLWGKCNKATVGAQVQLRGCRIRYEEYHFNNDG